MTCLCISMCLYEECINKKYGHAIHIVSALHTAGLCGAPRFKHAYCVVVKNTFTSWCGVCKCKYNYCLVCKPTLHTIAVNLTKNKMRTWVLAYVPRICTLCMFVFAGARVVGQEKRI